RALRSLRRPLRPLGGREGRQGGGRAAGNGGVAVEYELLTLFPRLVAGPLEESILGKAVQRGLISVRVRDIRDFATDKHRTTDDTPYGGGAGMVMKPEPLVDAIEAARAAMGGPARVILMDPKGRQFTQEVARELHAAE